MRYLTIEVSADGDVRVNIHANEPDEEDLEGACVYGPELIERESDPQYWPECACVVLETP